MKRTVRINFKDFWFNNNEGDLTTNPLYQYLSEHFDLQVVDDPDFLIYSCFGKEYLKHQCVRIFYTGENVRPRFDECDFSFTFDHPTDERNYRLPLYRFYVKDFSELQSRHRHIDAARVLAGKTGFCNFVYSNAQAKERIEFFHLLSKYQRVDSGGRVLNNLGHNVDDKVAFLKQYKFTIAFDNSSYPGYTTEKMIEPFIANSIPIYWGNPEVARDFNPKAFINCHDYTSFDEVVEKVIEIDQDDELYQQYLKEPIFAENPDNLYLDDANTIGRFEKIFSLDRQDSLDRKKRPARDLAKYVYCRVSMITRPRINALRRKFGANA